MALLTTMPLYLQSQGFSALEARLGGTARFGRPTTTLNRPGGVIPGYGGQLAVTPGSGLAVSVATGAVEVGGGSAGQGDYTLVNPAARTLNLAAADPSSDRIDVIVARIRDDEWGDDLADAGGYLEVITGTPGAGVPSLPAGGTVLTLAEVTVGDGETTISGGAIADKRRWSVAVGGVLPCPSSAHPADPYPGLEIFETDTKLKLIWDGTSWVYTPFRPAYLELTRLDGSYQSIASGGSPGAYKASFNRVPHADGISASTPVTDITIPSGYSGKYLVTYTGAFYGGYAGIQRTLQLWRGFEILAEDRKTPVASNTIPTTVGGSTTLHLAAGDVIFLTAYHDNGSALQLGYDTVLPRLTLNRLSD